jgi:hypothetical protein
VQAILNNLSEQIYECHRHAEYCARQASLQIDPKLKNDYFAMEGRWLTLARSCVFDEAWQIAAELLGKS